MGFDLFNPKTPPLIGVDISSSSIKMVELSRSKNSLKLERYSIAALEEGVVVDGAVANAEALNSALETCFRKLGSKVKNAAAAVPSSFVVMKPTKLRADLSEKQMEEEVNTELANLISFDINEAGVDFKVLTDTVNTELNEVTVFMFAALRQRVDERANALDAAGLKPVVMDSESLATIDAVCQFMDRVSMYHQDKTILVMDIGSTATHFTFLRNSEPVYTRDHAFGGSQFTRDLQDQLGVSAQEAEKLKLVGPSDEQSQVYGEVSKNFAEAVATEARRAVQLFTTSTNFTTVDHVLLHGGSAVADGVLGSVQEILSVDTHILNPFDGMTVASSIDTRKFSKDAPSLVVACGLAMRRFDK